MALTVGEFTASVGLDSSMFDSVLADLQQRFDGAVAGIAKRAEEIGGQVASRIGAAKGPIAGAAANVGVQAATALGGGLLSLLGGPVFSLLSSGLQAGLTAVVGLLTEWLQPAFSAIGNFINGTLVPAFQALGQWIANNQTPLMIVGGIILAFFLPALVQLGIAAAVAAASTIAAFAAMVAQAIASSAVFVAQTAKMLVQWGLMGWQSLAAAAKMAAAWLLAMGPIPLIIAAVVGLVALIIANWDTVVAWTKAAFQAIWNFLKMIWDAIVAAIRAAVNGVLAAIGWLGQLPGRVAAWFGSVLSAAVGKLGELLNWLGGLPGRILSALGNLGNLLVNVGKSILEGLWNGLKSAANWVKDQILNLIKAIIPGPIKDILGIGSPSKVAAELGRWVPIGLAKGIEDASGVVARASGELAGLVAGNLGNLSVVAGPQSLAPAAIAAAAGGLTEQRAVVQIENFYATPDQTPADIASDLDWMSRGGG